MEINPPPSLEKLGGKGFHLYKLREICRVPEFFVVSFDDPEEVESPVVQQSIREEWIRGGFSLAAVRSSASIEDSASRSFAGIFETILGVSSENLIGAVRQVVKSLKSERVKSYMDAHGVKESRIRMNVIVQKLLGVTSAGVSFSQVYQSDNKIIIEACFGLGEALVSGRITPDAYFVSRESLLIETKRVAYQSVFMTLDKAGAPSYEQVPFFRRSAQKLSDNQIKEVAQLAMLIETRLSLFPADIEWAFEGNTLFALQARRFTGLPD